MSEALRNKSSHLEAIDIYSDGGSEALEAIIYIRPYD